MLQFDEYKVKLNNIAPALKELAQALDLESAARELDMLQAESASDGFWDNLAKAQKIQQRIKNLQAKVDGQAKRQSQWDDLMALCEMGNEFEDESLIPELEEGFALLETEMEDARLATLLTGEYDSSNVILTIHPGAGGTEAQDWAQMLYRMYTRWAERHGYTVVREMCGHGIGKKMHEDPEVPNYGRRGVGPMIKNGLCIAIEPMINLGSRNIVIERDGWTCRTKDRKPSAHYEHTVAVHDGETEILTTFDYIDQVLGDRAI